MSGVHEFESGAVRSTDADDVAYDLVSPIGLDRLARTCKEGEKKYSAYNWEKGMDIRVMLNHAIRHCYKYLSGDRSEDHLAHAAWNLFGAMHSEELWPHLNEGQLRGPGCSTPAVRRNAVPVKDAVSPATRLMLHGHPVEITEETPSAGPRRVPMRHSDFIAQAHRELTDASQIKGEVVATFDSRDDL